MSIPHLFLIGLIASALLLGPLIAAGAGDGDRPRIEEVAPNPVSEGDRGEFVLLWFPEPTDVSGWTLTDGIHTVTFPNRTFEGSIAFTDAPSVAELLIDEPVVAWEGYLPLAADGEDLSLVDSSGVVVDRVSYRRTGNGERWVRDGDELDSQIHGQTDLQFETHPDTPVRTFLLPDAPELPVNAIEQADDRLFLAGYELTDPEVRDVVLDRYAAGVDVRVLVDGKPIGGQSTAEQETLDAFIAWGIPVRVLTGARSRFRYHHPKYAIVDDSALVMSENWKPAGTGGASSRGWGVRIFDPGVADDLATVFEADFGWRDAVSWERHRMSVSGRETEPNGGRYDSAFAPETLTAEAATVVVAPDRAESVMVDLISNASESVDIQQVRIGDPNFPLIDAVREAAQSGVRVRIHLDSTWYVVDENERIRDALEAEDLPIEVRLAEPGSRYGKIHTKGVIVDEEVVVVGSMNWNNVSMRENREVMLVLEGEEVASYYSAAFESDWSPPGDRVPVGMVGAVLVAWAGAAVIASRRVRFAT